jgi:hypothetical protein
MKSGNLNFLERSGPLQACNGSALPLLSPEEEAVLFRKAVFYGEIFTTVEEVLVNVDITYGNH